jgi:RNA polymerase sigma-70 factor (ECF subfamily)
MSTGTVPVTAGAGGRGGGAVTDAAREHKRRDLIELARAAGRGEADALSQLVRTTSPVVWRACAALVDRDSAEDLTQDTYLRAMRSLSSYRGDSDPTRWLLTIARRVCAEEISRRQRARVLEVRLQAERNPDRSDPHALADLGDVLERLSEERREAFVLTAVAGLSYAEAAAVCECPIGTIRSRVSRARSDLIDLLHGDDPDRWGVRRSDGSYPPALLGGSPGLGCPVPARRASQAL